MARKGSGTGCLHLITMKFTDKILYEKNDAIILVTGHLGDGSRCYAYIRVTRKSEQSLKNACENNRPIELNSLGDILLGGPGLPGTAEQSYMETHYQFDHRSLIERGLIKKDNNDNE